MADARYLRQLGIYNPGGHNRQHDAVTFIGVGGIGSFAALAVAKLGVPNITVIDPDTIEEHNQPNQLPNASYIGEPKVRAMGAIIGREMQTTAKLHMYRDSIQTYTNPLEGVVVSGLDSMEAREETWDRVKLNPKVPLYIDGRLSGQLIVLYVVNPLDFDQIEQYKNTLHSDEEGEDVSCTERGIIDVGLMVGSLVSRTVRRHFTSEPVKNVTVVNQETLIVTQYDWSAT